MIQFPTALVLPFDAASGAASGAAVAETVGAVVRGRHGSGTRR